MENLCINLSKFSETLEELMFYKEINATELSQAIGLDLSAITKYLHENHAPLPSSLVLIADYFNVTCDFLLGLENENRACAFNPCPPFGERLTQLSKGDKVLVFCRKTGISSAQYYRWKNGENQPTIYNIHKIAKALDCTIDYVLGREK